MRMLNSDTTALDQILMMGRITKGHEGLGFWKKGQKLNLMPSKMQLQEAEITITNVVGKIIHQEDKDSYATIVRS